MRKLVVLASSAGALFVAIAGCTSPMEKILGLRDALQNDIPAGVTQATAGFPACADVVPKSVVPAGTFVIPEATACLTDLSAAFGSKKGFAASPPDQAAASAVALVLLRDHRGDYVAHADAWLGTVKSGKGPGPDSLRMATARQMGEASPAVGREIDAEADALAMMKAVASAIPGACATYRLLGTGADPKSLPPELTAEHSACVQKDLMRRDGMGASYGSGTFRAAEGAIALWREAERALRLGLTITAPEGKPMVEARLKLIEEASQKNRLKKLPPETSSALMFLGDVHADAGVRLWKGADAGADASAEAGARMLDAGTGDAGKPAK